jgi:hypothetical protein
LGAPELSFSAGICELAGACPLVAGPDAPGAVDRVSTHTCCATTRNFPEVRYASLAVIPLYAYAVVGSASEALSAALDPGAGRFAITIKNDPHIIQ